MGGCRELYASCAVDLKSSWSAYPGPLPLVISNLRAPKRMTNHTMAFLIVKGASPCKEELMPRKRTWELLMAPETRSKSPKPQTLRLQREDPCKEKRLKHFISCSLKSLIHVVSATLCLPSLTLNPHQRNNTAHPQTRGGSQQ